MIGRILFNRHYRPTLRKASQLYKLSFRRMTLLGRSPLVTPALQPPWEVKWTARRRCNRYAPESLLKIELGEENHAYHIHLGLRPCLSRSRRTGFYSNYDIFLRSNGIPFRSLGSICARRRHTHLHSTVDITMPSSERIF